MTDDAPAEALKQQLRLDLAAALKARRGDEVRALRALLAAIDNAEAVEGPSLSSSSSPPASNEHVAGSVAGVGAAEAARRTLSASDLERIMEAEVTELVGQADRFAEIGRADDAARLRVEEGVLARYRYPNG